VRGRFFNDVEVGRELPHVAAINVKVGAAIERASNVAETDDIVTKTESKASLQQQSQWQARHGAGESPPARVQEQCLLIISTTGTSPHRTSRRSS